MINQLRHKKAWRQLSFKKNNHGTQENQDNVRQKGQQVIESSGESSSLTPKQGELPSSISNQLATPKTTPQSITTPPPFQTRYTGNGEAKCKSIRIQDQIHDQAPIEDVVAVRNGPLINTNVTQRRRKRKKTHKGTIALNVIEPTIMRTGNSTDINVVTIIEVKRSRQPNPKHAQTT